jgi:hypothetical protein
MRQKAAPKYKRGWQLNLRRCGVDARANLMDLRSWIILRWGGVMKHAYRHEMLEIPIERRNDGYLCLK